MCAEQASSSSNEIESDHRLTISEIESDQRERLLHNQPVLKLTPCP